MKREPRYLRIAAGLSRAIQEGEYQPGDRLPPKAKLIERLRRLTADGAERPRSPPCRGRSRHATRRGNLRQGASQAPAPEPQQARPVPPRERAGPVLPRHGGRRDGRIGSCGGQDRGGEAETALALEIAEGDETLVRDLVLFADDEPVELARTALPRELTRGTLIEEVDSGPGGTYARLEEIGHRVAYFVEAVSARRVTADESTTLRIASGTSVLKLRRVAHSDAGKPIEVTDMVIASDRYELVYEIAVE